MGGFEGCGVCYLGPLEQGFDTSGFIKMLEDYESCWMDLKKREGKWQLRHLVDGQPSGCGRVVVWKKNTWTVMIISLDVLAYGLLGWDVDAGTRSFTSGELRLVIMPFLLHVQSNKS